MLQHVNFIGVWQLVVYVTIELIHHLHLSEIMSNPSPKAPVCPPKTVTTLAITLPELTTEVYLPLSS